MWIREVPENMGCKLHAYTEAKVGGSSVSEELHPTLLIMAPPPVLPMSGVFPRSSQENLSLAWSHMTGRCPWHQSCELGCSRLDAMASPLGPEA